MTTATVIAAIESLLVLAKSDATTSPPTYTGPCLAGFLSARAQNPPDGSYPSAWTWVQAQATDGSNLLTPDERAALFGATIRFGRLCDALPATMTYAEVLFRFLRPESYSARTGALITDADRAAEKAAQKAWDDHWVEKEKQKRATLPAGYYWTRAELLAAHPLDAIKLDGKLIQAGFGNSATGDPFEYKTLADGSIAPQ